ncbi:nuclear transport factor 2 family protein [Antarctobacter sp.]|uniref:nuclear transport factor 2 family protein n=1 Tax=Antarctobacter sp. TaxID=1872577 RepID=UPI003A937ED2
MTAQDLSRDFDPAALAGIVARQAIWDCLLRYIRGVDRMDQVLIRAAIWEDARITHGPVSGGVEDFIAGWHPAQAARDVSFHHVSNQTVELDGAQAHCEAYFMAALRKTGAEKLEMVGGRYIDLFERRDTTWRIKTRLVLLDWQGLLDASQMETRLATRHRGSRDATDPSYERPVRPRKRIDTPWEP